MKAFDAPRVPLRSANAKKLLAIINREYGTLAFCRKWLEEHMPKHLAALKNLVDAGIVNEYPPLSD